MQLPYWRLSAFYFAYFAFVGSFSPYWSLYLKSLAFAPFQIAVLMSLFQVARIFAPSLWGWLADHLGQRVSIIQWLSALSLLSYAGVFVGTSYAWLFAVMLLLSFFWSASLPLIETVTLGHLGDRFDKYGHIRMWGLYRCGDWPWVLARYLQYSLIAMGCAGHDGRGLGVLS